MILDGVCGTECDIRENFDTNKYPNIFVSKNLPERISEYIHNFFLTRTNVRINICIKKLCGYLNIFEYSSSFYTLTHSGMNVWINIRDSNIWIFKYSNIFVTLECGSLRDLGWDCLDYCLAEKKKTIYIHVFFLSNSCILLVLVALLLRVLSL